MADHHSHSHPHSHGPSPESLGGVAPSHSHSHDHTRVEANKNHFDEAEAERYEKRTDVLELNHRLSQEILKAYQFDEETSFVMDFACGPGLMSRELAPFVKTILGVDISDAMVKRYNQRVSEQGILPEEMRAVTMELKGAPDELNGQKFDVIICSMAYHHLDSIESMTKILAFHLKPGGFLMVADIVKEPHIADKVFPEDAPFIDIVVHRGGFDADDMKQVFDAAGLTEATFDRVTSGKKSGQSVGFFLAKAMKPVLSIRDTSLVQEAM